MPDPAGEIERRMRPGAWDSVGFLLDNDSLRETVAADDAACRRLGTTPEAIGLRLVELLRDSAGSDAGRPVRRGDVAVEIIRQRGMVTCPWAPEEFAACQTGPEGRPTANQFRIVGHGHVLTGFELSAHLIAAHAFFGGIGTRFRIEPADAVVALES